MPEESKNENQFYCSDCDSPIKETDKYCPKCGANVEEVEQQDNVETKNIFKGSVVFGGILEQFGWFLVIISVVAIIYLFTTATFATSFFISLIISATLLMFGLQFVAIGQYIRCHVQIEMNTRRSFLYLKKIYENNRSVKTASKVKG